MFSIFKFKQRRKKFLFSFQKLLVVLFTHSTPTLLQSTVVRKYYLHPFGLEKLPAEILDTKNQYQLFFCFLKDLKSFDESIFIYFEGFPKLLLKRLDSMIYLCSSFSESQILNKYFLSLMSFISVFVFSFN